MPEQCYDIKLIGVRYVCDTCGKGEMRFSGIERFTNPPIYQHVCSDCGARADLFVQYPTIRWDCIGETM